MGFGAKGFDVTATDGSTVKFEIRDRVAWLTLSRPEALNALNVSMIEGLQDAVNLVRDGNARCLVITGSGRAFCAGADLKGAQQDRSNNEGMGQSVSFLRRIRETFADLRTLSAPTIAAVNGAAIAGGLELVLACDLVVAARSARIGDGHAVYGLLPAAGGTALLPRRIGRNMANYLLFTGASVPAQELVEAGLVNEVVDDDRLEPRVEEICSQIVSRSPRVLARLKSLVEESSALDVEAALSLEFEHVLDNLGSADVAEGLQAFTDGRKPCFADRKDS